MIELILKKLTTGEEMFLFGVFVLIALYIIVKGIVVITEAFMSIFEKRYIYLKKKNGNKNEDTTSKY
jgi:hypothetical protein